MKWYVCFSGVFENSARKEKEGKSLTSKKTLHVCPPGPEGVHEKGWVWDPVKRQLRNTRIPVATQVVDVYDQEGSWNHEGVVTYLEGQTHLAVVVHESGKIGLIYIRREKVIPPNAMEEFFSANPKGMLGIEHIYGIEEYECPHGIATKKEAEVEEEMGLKPLEMLKVGYVKANPSHGGQPHFLWAVLVGDMRSRKRADVSEQIRRVEFFEPEDVDEVLAHSYCGLTKAALWTFRAWGKKQPKGSFWHEVARRL